MAFRIEIERNPFGDKNVTKQNQRIEDANDASKQGLLHCLSFIPRFPPLLILLLLL